jgi:hypothetical protein
MKKYAPKPNRRVLGKFQQFLKLNGMAPDMGLEACMGQMVRAGLSPGTIGTYVTTIVTSIPSLRNSSVAKRAMAAAQAYHTHKGGRGHASDIPQDIIEEVTKKINEMTPELGPSAWIAMATGLRASCIDRLSTDGILIRGSGAKRTLSLKIRFSKGVRKVRKRREVHYPLKDIPPPPKSLKRRLTGGPLSTPLPTTAANLNAALAKACDSLNVKRFTSGAYRRAFARRIRPYCEANNLSVSEMLVHTSTDMVPAHYSFDVTD